jgi:DNA processing protein
MNSDELATLLALTEIDGLGNKRALELFRAFESEEELRSSSLQAFDDFHYVTRETYDQIQGLSEIIQDYRERIEQYRADDIHVIGINDPRYPESLRRLHSPLVLYARGDLDLLQDRSVSVSGARETNSAGKEWVRQTARELASEGYTIISGGALGTDTAAHQGALDSTGATIVVLGTGVNTPYPEENAELFSDIVDQGGLLLSHRKPSAGPVRYAFLNRNKTISALSPGVIIVATDGSGGTISQYEDAVDQNRLVFIPDSEFQIEPSSGLDDLRGLETTTVVSSAEAIQTELSARLGISGDDSVQTEGTEPGEGQSSLDQWR